MQLTLLGHIYYIAALGDDEGRVFTVPFQDLEDVEIVQAVPWHSQTVKVPERLEKKEGGSFELKTRDLEMTSKIIPETALPILCAFDPVTKTWYVYET